MDSLSAFALGAENKDNERKVFDWIKAAEIIKSRNPESAIAGLRTDMEWTSGTIWENGAIDRGDGCYLASTWATPILELDFGNSITEEIECWRIESETPGWSEYTIWPKEALEILNEVKFA